MLNFKIKLEAVSYVFIMVICCLCNTQTWAAPPTGKTGGPPPMPVEAAAVSTGTVNVDLSAVGSLQANESVIIRPEISGRIQSIQFEEGQSVKKGAILVTLDPSEYQSLLAESQASVKLAQLKYQRSKDLLKKNLSSQQQYDEDAAKLDEAKSQRDVNKDRLAKTIIRAPFGGVVGLRTVSPGEVVQPGQDMVNLEDLHLLKLDFRVPEIYLPNLKNGLKVTVVVDAFPNEVFNGEVYAIAPRVEESSRSVLLRARINNVGNRLRPGIFAKVNLRLASRENALLVPEEALWPVGKDMFVYRVVEGKAQMTSIKVGKRMKGRVEVIEGLNMGDMVITAGQMKLRNEAPVMVVNQAKPTTSGTSK